MKICLFTHTLPRFFGDTAAPFIGELAESIVKQGQKVIVLAPFDEKIDKTHKKNYQLRTYRYIFPEKFHLLGYSRTLKGDKTMGLLVYLISPFLYFFAFFALLRLVQKEKVDIISAHWIIPNGFIAALVSKITGVPFTVTIPGSDIYLGGKNFFFRWLVGVAAGGASLVISDSPFYLKQLNDLGFFPNRTRIIRYGVNTTKFQPKRKRENAPPIILAVGRMVAKKGFHYLIKAMPLVLEKILPAKLILVGDGEERNNLEQSVRRLKIEKNVTFVGTVPYSKLAEYYRLADVFVMPSIRDEKGNIDASPVAMMEAMACGVPVVATLFAGDNDLVVKNKTGYLVKERDYKSIAEAIVKLLLRGRNKLKKEVRKVAVSNFSSKVIAREYTRCFRESILSK